jgi:hypothetical protein
MYAIPPPVCTPGELAVDRRYAAATKLEVMLPARPDTAARQRRREAAIKRLGVRITAFYTDAIENTPLAKLSSRPSVGGTVFYRSSCSELRCSYSAQLVPEDGRPAAQARGLFFEQTLFLEAASPGALAEARRHVSLQYRCKGKLVSVPLTELALR